MNAKKAQVKKAPAKKTKPPAAPDLIQESYDELPYESYVYPQSHPERMHTIARLFKLAPVDIHKARILEIGCASGGNLIPVAMLYPKTKCLGIDLSGEQIALANQDKKAMGLKNIEFRQLDITKMDKNAGEFDYIICHGVFSWVPDAVRESIYKVCRRHLSKNGLAVVSYNTLPGWAAVKSLREMMLFHTRDFKSPAQQIHEAKQLLNFLYENTPAANGPYRQTIDRERKILSTTNDSYIFHEHLETENHQFYLHDFVKMAGDHDLVYVGDAEISTMYLGHFNEKVQKTLGTIKDIVRQEQYIDFLSNRRFRHSILTHTKNAPQINRTLMPERLMEFYLQARFKLDPKAADAAKTQFISTSSNEATFTTGDKNGAIVLRALAEKQRPIKIEELAAEMKKNHNMDPEFAKALLLKNGLQLVLQNFISLHEHPAAGAPTVSKTPQAFSWTRYQTKKNVRTLTNMRRETINLPPFTRTLIPYLDGKTSHEELIEKMTQHVLKGDLKMNQKDQPVTDVKKIRDLMKPQLETGLNSLARLGMLEA